MYDVDGAPVHDCGDKEWLDWRGVCAIALRKRCLP